MTKAVSREPEHCREIFVLNIDIYQHWIKAILIKLAEFTANKPYDFEGLVTVLCILDAYRHVIISLHILGINISTTLVLKLKGKSFLTPSNLPLNWVSRSVVYFSNRTRMNVWSWVAV